MQAIKSLVKDVEAILDGHTIILEVPYHSQEDPDARHYRNDCGPDCLEMIMQYFGRTKKAVDVLSGESHLSVQDNGLTMEQIAALLKKEAFPCQVRSSLTIGAIEAELSKGRPVLCLINYTYIPRENVPDHYGHFVLVVGITDTHVLLNDPDYWGIRRNEGDHKQILRADFLKALEYAPIAYTGIFLDDSVSRPNKSPAPAPVTGDARTNPKRIAKEPVG